jgi:hypothetical protein
VHTTSLAALLALSVSASAQQLIALDSNRTLYELDPATAAPTQIGVVTSNAGTAGGLAYDDTTGTLFLTSSSLDSVYSVDLTTAVATLIGGYGSALFVMHGLEFDSSTNTLYGLSSHDNGLYVVDPTTGVATLVGTTGLTSFTNLGYDSNADVLYATNSSTDSFYSIDRSTGAATLIGPLVGPTNPHGLAYDAATSTMYLVCSNTDSLYTVDLTTGLTTLIGALGSGNYLGLAFVPGAPTSPTNFCTAGLSTNGCVPSISADNQPSASMAASCVLTVSNVEGQKVGLVFYGIDNTSYSAAPWGAGTSFLCIKSPTQRMPAQNSGGTAGQCSGVLTNDWYAFLALSPGALGSPFSVGDKIYAQAWYRDPPASKTTNLSDALELTYAP